MALATKKRGGEFKKEVIRRMGGRGGGTKEQTPTKQTGGTEWGGGDAKGNCNV